MSSIHHLLRAATADAHVRLEQRVALLEDLTEPRYVAVLAATRSFYAPLEARLREVEPWAYDADRTRWLDEDLRHLGITEPPEPEEELPPVEEPSDAFGCAYVLEGASLGGVVIARRLARRFPGALRFFTGHGPAVGRRWRAFLRRLEQSRTLVPLDEKRAMSAAVETFERLERCLERAGALRR